MGRPPSGNKAFLIRMKPETHDDLLRAAKADGYKRMGEWLDNVPAELVHRLSSPARLKTPSAKLLSDAFREYATEVARALDEMRLIVERNPMLDEDVVNRKAFQNLRQQYVALIQRMRPDRVRGLVLLIETTPDIYFVGGLNHKYLKVVREVLRGPDVIKPLRKSSKFKSRQKIAGSISQTFSV